MRINHNISALNTYGNFLKNTNIASKSMEKLSSGLRINRAGDDAAGLSISEGMRAQIRGLEQSSRNIQDSISLIQVAEGGLNETHALLQRGRELSVQATSSTMTSEDKVTIENEITQIQEEVDRIANNTEFNTIKLLNRSGVSTASMQNVLDALQKGWLQASESLVQSALGFGGGGATMEFELADTIDGPSNTMALVQYSYTPGVPGTGSNLKMRIDMQDFKDALYPDANVTVAGPSTLNLDRIIAHEVVHAVTAAQINVSTGMESWFMEGLAEAVTGADERLRETLTRVSSSTLASTIGTGTNRWGGGNDDYSMAYSAVRFLDHLIATGGGSGVRDLVTYMQSDTTKTLGDAIDANAQLDALGINSVTDFENLFKSAAPGGGVEYIDTVLSPFLGDADTGSLVGSNRSLAVGNGAGTVLDNNDIVDETPFGTITADPLTSFTETWPASLAGSDATLTMQLGANAGQNTKISLFNATSTNLGLSAVDVRNDANSAITIFDTAIKTVSGFRSTAGAQQNRLEHALSSNINTQENLIAAESRIRDTDMAKEMMTYQKANILSQAAQAMIAQANQLPQGVLQLLR